MRVDAALAGIHTPYLGNHARERRGGVEIRAYLADLAVDGREVAETHNQTRNALLFPDGG